MYSPVAIIFTDNFCCGSSCVAIICNHQHVNHHIIKPSMLAAVQSPPLLMPEAVGVSHQERSPLTGCENLPTYGFTTTTTITTTQQPSTCNVAPPPSLPPRLFIPRWKPQNQPPPVDKLESSRKLRWRELNYLHAYMRRQVRIEETGIYNI